MCKCVNNYAKEVVTIGTIYKYNISYKNEMEDYIYKLISLKEC